MVSSLPSALSRFQISNSQARTSGPVSVVSKIQAVLRLVGNQPLVCRYALCVPYLARSSGGETNRTYYLVSIARHFPLANRTPTDVARRNGPARSDPHGCLKYLSYSRCLYPHRGVAIRSRLLGISILFKDNGLSPMFRRSDGPLAV